MAKYKWDKPYEWLEHAATNWSSDELYCTMMSLAGMLDSDTLQETFQSEMAADGFFQDLDIVQRLSKDQCVDLLIDAGIDVDVSDTEESLRDRVALNIGDTLEYSEIEELINKGCGKCVDCGAQCYSGGEGTVLCPVCDKEEEEIE